MKSICRNGYRDNSIANYPISICKMDLERVEHQKRKVKINRCHIIIWSDSMTQKRNKSRKLIVETYEEVKTKAHQENKKKGSYITCGMDW